jgi:hypothetical protein
MPPVMLRDTKSNLTLKGPTCAVSTYNKSRLPVSVAAITFFGHVAFLPRAGRQLATIHGSFIRSGWRGNERGQEAVSPSAIARKAVSVLSQSVVLLSCNSRVERPQDLSASSRLPVRSELAPEHCLTRSMRSAERSGTKGSRNTWFVSNNAERVQKIM